MQLANSETKDRQSIPKSVLSNNDLNQQHSSDKQIELCKDSESSFSEEDTQSTENSHE
jgi:hypothetical protein